jgi:hypothetical protein
VFSSKCCLDYSQYEGDFKNNLFHGRGIITELNGASYDGTWENGMKNGQGMQIYFNGDVYKGEFLDDKRDSSIH